MSGDRGRHGISSFLRSRRLGNNILPTIRHWHSHWSWKALLNKVRVIQSLNSHARTGERLLGCPVLERNSNRTSPDHLQVSRNAVPSFCSLVWAIENYFSQGHWHRRLTVVCGLLVIHCLPSVLLAIRFVNGDGVTSYQKHRTGPTRCLKLLSFLLGCHFDFSIYVMCPWHMTCLQQLRTDQPTKKFSAV